MASLDVDRILTVINRDKVMEHLSNDVVHCPSFTPSKDQRLRCASKLGHRKKQRLEILYVYKFSTEIALINSAVDQLLFVVQNPPTDFLAKKLHPDKARYYIHFISPNW